jgi:hypothetical protein
VKGMYTLTHLAYGLRSIFLYSYHCLFYKAKIFHVSHNQIFLFSRNVATKHILLDPIGGYEGAISERKQIGKINRSPKDIGSCEFAICVVSS